jgi:hypothetical protein
MDAVPGTKRAGCGRLAVIISMLMWLGVAPAGVMFVI